MNAFRNTLQRQAQRRFASSSAAMPKQPVPEVYQKSFNWFSDPSTYPLIFVMTFASGLIVGASAYQWTHLKDLRVNSKYKHETIQTWGTDHNNTVTSRLASNPKAFHKQSFKDIRQEGLGVDHEEWKKGKQAYYQE